MLKLKRTVSAIVCFVILLAANIAAENHSFVFESPGREWGNTKISCYSSVLYGPIECSLTMVKSLKPLCRSEVREKNKKVAFELVPEKKFHVH